MLRRIPPHPVWPAKAEITSIAKSFIDG